MGSTGGRERMIPLQYALRRRLMINASKELSISSLPLGTLIRIADSDGGHGVANYEIADIDNLVSGGAVLVRKNVYSTSKAGTGAYPNTTLDTLMKNTIYGKLPKTIQDNMLDVTFALYNYGSITRKVFALTYTMVGGGNNNNLTEGKALQRYNSNANRIKTYANASYRWWLSSDGIMSTKGRVETDGTIGWLNPSTSLGVVPAFAISMDTAYDPTPNTDGSYNLIL